MREDITRGIEELTGRKVIAFMSDNHFEPDLAVELVLLEPRPNEGAPETGRSDAR